MQFHHLVQSESISPGEATTLADRYLILIHLEKWFCYFTATTCLTVTFQIWPQVRRQPLTPFFFPVRSAFHAYLSLSGENRLLNSAAVRWCYACTCKLQHNVLCWLPMMFWENSLQENSYQYCSCHYRSTDPHQPRRPWSLEYGQACCPLLNSL